MIDEDEIINEGSHTNFIEELRTTIDKVLIRKVVTTDGRELFQDKYLVVIARAYGVAPVYFSDVPSGENQESIYSWEIERVELTHTNECGTNFPLPTGIGNWHCTCNLHQWMEDNYWSVK